MKKFSFTLQKILEIKEQMLDNLKIELGGLNNNLARIEASINNLKAQLQKIEKEFIEKSSVSISVGEMTYYKMLTSSILKQIENKEEEKCIVLRKIEAKRQEIISMNVEISSLEKLKEKEKDKYNKTLNRNEEIFIEEFVLNNRGSKRYAI